VEEDGFEVLMEEINSSVPVSVAEKSCRKDIEHKYGAGRKGAVLYNCNASFFIIYPSYFILCFTIHCDYRFFLLFN